MYHDEAYEVKIEGDEDGFHLVLKCESLDLNIRIQDVAEQLHDAVRAGIAPWLRERDEARVAVASGVTLEEFTGDIVQEPFGYEPDDPKHPGYHSLHADLWDSREGK